MQIGAEPGRETAILSVCAHRDRTVDVKQAELGSAAMIVTQQTAKSLAAFDVTVNLADFVTGLPLTLALAGPANRQGRIAADAIFGHQYIYYKVGADTIEHNAMHPSRLLLPVVPR